jgi:hypothetical protein
MAFAIPLIGLCFSGGGTALTIGGVAVSGVGTALAGTAAVAGALALTSSTVDNKTTSSGDKDDDEDDLRKFLKKAGQDQTDDAASALRKETISDDERALSKMQRGLEDVNTHVSAIAETVGFANNPNAYNASRVMGSLPGPT